MQQRENRRFDGGRRRVLVVDDDLAIRVLLNAVLGRLNFEVFLAEDGAAALKKLQEGAPFELLLLDLMMPKVNGYEVILGIRELPIPRRPHIIVFTGVGQAGLEKIPAAAICNSILKPFDLEPFIQMVSDCIERNHVPVQSATVS